nr:MULTISPECIES: YdeI/OmpD-associated family protein [unclassified Limnothrix]
MHPNGLRIVEIAQASGAWSALDEVENLTLPPDLESFLQQNQYLETWHALSRSFKRGFLEQLLNCKKAETRARKIESLRSKLE